MSYNLDADNISENFTCGKGIQYEFCVVTSTYEFIRYKVFRKELKGWEIYPPFRGLNFYDKKGVEYAQQLMKRRI